MTPRETRQLEAVRRLLGHVGMLLQSDLHVRLWTGEVVPLGAGADGTVGIRVAGPQVLTALLRRPQLDTVIRLFAAGDLAIEGGTLLDVAARRGSARTRGFARRLDKWLAARALAPFLLGSATTAADEGFRGQAAASVDAGRDDKALVQFHYDLSNAFYGLFLDPEMVYSCAYFPDATTTLEEAQRAKLDMICRKLRLKPGDRFLDIGCGWGGLVCHAVQHYGVTAHGVTLAEEQFALATRRAAERGIADRVTIELRDYRALDRWESYDKIASIGMFEHVGLANHATYFTQMHRLLRPRGLYLHHCIARLDKRSKSAFARRRAEVAAMQRYIFPGGELDSIGMSVSNLERHGFEVHDVEAWREHYATTCRLWTERLHARQDEAAAEIGWPKTRLWLLYLAGCSLAFQRGTLNIFQTLASKRDKGPSGLPPSRADLYR